MIKLKDLIKTVVKEIDFKDKEAFKKYQAKHKMRPTTKINIAGKDTTVGDASSDDKKMSDTEKEMDTAAKYANVKMDRGEALDIIKKGKLTPDNMQDTFDMIKNYAEWMGYEEIEDFEMDLPDIIDDGDVDTFESYAEELLDPDKKEKDMGKTLAQMDYDDEDSPETYWDGDDDDSMKASKQANKKMEVDDLNNKAEDGNGEGIDTEHHGSVTWEHGDPDEDSFFATDEDGETVEIDYTDIIRFWNDDDDESMLKNLKKESHIPKLKDLLTEVKFKVTLEKRNKQIDSQDFTKKTDAKRHIAKMIKKHKLRRQKGFWGNPKTGVELSTNF